MGYTHYWKITKAIDNETWSAICADVRLLVAKKHGLLCYEYDEPTNPPIIIDADDDRIIRFNGKADNGHETFILHSGRTDFKFCKTARKPYDLMVCAVLAVAKKHAPDCITVSSDGQGEDGWDAATAFVESVLGYFPTEVMLDIER